jgi:hypothetical protein
MRDYVVELTTDLAIDGWDLARATGQDDALDPGAVAVLLLWAEANAPDGIRLPACSAAWLQTRQAAQLIEICCASLPPGALAGLTAKQHRA